MAEAVMTPHQIQLVKATVPVLKDHGTTITTHFYKRMLGNHPELNNIFNQAHQVTGAQPTALAHAVFAFAAHLDNLGALSKAVSIITHKHCSLNILPEQYPIVGENLLASFKEVLGDALDDATVEAWGLAYGLLANILIGVEKQMYDTAEAAEGGWRGWRKFNVAKKVVESSSITSFYLEPVDGKPVANYKPGQFTTIKRFIPELGYEQPRQYTISTEPNSKYLRISVKRELARDTIPHGQMSSLLHTEIKEGTEVQLSPPFGDFFLNEEEDTPVVLISAGVGLTPMISMLESLTHPKTEGAEVVAPRKVVFVHAAHNKQAHAMREFVADVAKKHTNVTKSVWYSDPSGAVEGEDYNHAGRLDLNKIQKEVILEGADYYLCGPVPFMRSTEEKLAVFGVKPDRIHSEVFAENL